MHALDRYPLPWWKPPLSTTVAVPFVYPHVTDAHLAIDMHLAHALAVLVIAARVLARAARVLVYVVSPLHPHSFSYVMANRANSEMFSGQAIMASESSPMPSATSRPNPSGTSSIPTAPSSLRPLTIKMLLDSFYEDTERYPLIIDGMPVSSIVLIGMVRNKSLSMDHCTFDLYDGTGSVNVYYWFDCPQDSKDACNGVYVRVVGRATSLQHFVQIKAYVVRTVKNFNDITHHFLYCIKAHIDVSRQSRLKENPVAVSSASTVMPRSHITPSQIPEQCSLEEKIFSILRDPAYRDIEHGVSLKLLRSAVGASQDDIMKVIAEQLRLGEMYTTIDERHFKSSHL